MFARALLMTGALLWLAPAAQADTDTESIILLHDQLQANFLASATQLEYGYIAPGYGDSFRSRESWQYLRLRSAGSTRATGTRMLLSRVAPKSRAPQYRVTTRVGGLGRRISAGAPSVSLHNITSGPESGGEPAFGNLHEGGSSFSFGGTSPGAQ